MITNKWLNPYQRSFQQIKAKLIESLTTIKDKNGQTLITDYSEGNILIIILSLFAAIAEVLHYYIDNVGRESFLSTARRSRSKELEFLRHRIKPIQSTIFCSNP